MTTKELILLENKVWVKEKLTLDKDYFNRLSALHLPKILWIGSIDNLVPIRDITNTEPGEILAYRNIGNIISASDVSLMTMLEYALEAGIRHIVVCGYSHCGSLSDVINGTRKPMTKQWLSELQSLFERNHLEFEGKPFEEQERKLCELNVAQQIENLSKLSVIRELWKEGDYPKLYGWYFDLNTGLLSEVATREKNKLPG
jgi:carbonic anhydrase